MQPQTEFIDQRGIDPQSGEACAHNQGRQQHHAALQRVVRFRKEQVSHYPEHPRRPKPQRKADKTLVA
jgi:hypothetical protein